MDHITPKSEGGRNTIGNLVPCCRYCNAAKNKRGIEEFRGILKNKAFKAKFGVVFNDEQLVFLKNMGLELPTQEDYVFYFERKGLIGDQK